MIAILKSQVALIAVGLFALSASANCSQAQELREPQKINNGVVVAKKATTSPAPWAQHLRRDASKNVAPRSSSGG
jgi:hypothetical protein